MSLHTLSAKARKQTHNNRDERVTKLCTKPEKACVKCKARVIFNYCSRGK